MKTYLATVLFIAACGSSSNNPPATDGTGSNGSNADAKVFMDAPPNVPAMITISGTATQQAIGTPQPAPGVLVAAYRMDDPNTVVAMATTDSAGNYSLTLATNGMPLDGYLKATKTGNVDSYLFPPGPLVADFSNASVNELATGLYSTLAGSTESTTKSFVAIEVTDAAGMTVGGATVTATPAPEAIGYMGAILPDYTATATASDGRAFLQGVTPGNVMLGATKTGATFHSHTINAFVGAFVTTVITE